MTESNTVALVALLVGVAIGVALAAGALSVTDSGDSQPETTVDQSPATPPGALTTPTSPGDRATLEQFGTADAFREYVRAGQRRANLRPGSGGWNEFVGFDVQTTLAPTGVGDTGGGENSGPDRIAGSNVQVAGVDELDTVKTDGENFYYSPSAGRFGVGLPPVQPTPTPETGDTVFTPQANLSSHVLDASDPADPAALAAVDDGGELLQTGDRLVVFNKSGGAVVGYDVSDPANPVESWTLSIESRLVTARETGGQLYVVTRTFVAPDTDCPLRPLGGETIDCGEVYAPDSQTGAGATYTAFSVDASSGSIEDSVSLMGTARNSVVYMSPGGLYLTYTTDTSESELRLSWAEQSELVPETLADRLAEIADYNISERSKTREMRLAVERWADPTDGTRTLQEDYRAYRVTHQENLTRTTIVRIDVGEERLRVEETGTVPGEPLNQFALDEYKKTLRITTTIPRVAGAESDNSLYVLDNSSLDQEASVTGMGHDQRVYSVRYVGDTAYVVTFRQVDPFYVVDFESPTDPELLSELELPGFSSYLHPADDGHVIGIGEENGQVKSVLFDVTDPTDTAVADDLVLGEYWSAIEESHHAFTIDRRHEVFVLPAGNTARVVDYAGGNLEVVTEVTAEEEVTRARYVDDYLYVFAGGEVIVLDQTDWERTTTLRLDDD